VAYSSISASLSDVVSADLNARRARRFTVANVYAIYDLQDEFQIGPMLNVSSSGILLRLIHPLEVGSSIELFPCGPDTDVLGLFLTAKVARCHRNADATYDVACTLTTPTREQRLRVVAFAVENSY